MQISRSAACKGAHSPTDSSTPHGHRCYSQRGDLNDLHHELGSPFRPLSIHPLAVSDANSALTWVGVRSKVYPLLGTRITEL